MEKSLKNKTFVGFLSKLVTKRNENPNKIEKYKFLQPYLDPIMVVLVSGYFPKVPITNMGRQIQEVLGIKAENKYFSLCEEIVSPKNLSFSEGTQSQIGAFQTF